jgi:hypothetical protein
LFICCTPLSILLVFVVFALRNFVTDGGSDRAARTRTGLSKRAEQHEPANVYELRNRAANRWAP